VHLAHQSTDLPCRFVRPGKRLRAFASDERELFPAVGNKPIVDRSLGTRAA
jgi:hypothetical protein